MNIKLKSDDMAVICSALGFIKTCPGHKVTIESTNPDLNELFKYVGGDPKKFDKEMVMDSTEDTYQILDNIAHERRLKEIKDIAGVVVSNVPKSTQRIPDLVATYMFYNYGLPGKSGVYFPRYTSKKTSTCIIDCETKREMAEAYVKEFSRIEVTNVADMPLIEQIDYLMGKEVVAAFINNSSPLLWVLFGIYKDYDHMREVYPCFVTADENEIYDERRIAYWSACYPIHPLNTSEQGFILAQSFKFRDKCDHHHLNMFKKFAKPKEEGNVQ